MPDYSFSNYTSLIGAATSVTITPVSNTAVLQSSLSKGIQVVSRPGGRWRVDVTWGPLSDDKRRELEALISRLDGAANRLLFSPSQLAGVTARGPWSGTPVVNLAGQTGKSLNIRGATASVTDWARAGDWFRVGQQLLQMTANASTDVSGNATLEHWPELRGSPADAAAVDEDQQCAFRMVSNPALGMSVSNSIVSGGSFAGFAGVITASFIDVGEAV